MNFLEQIHQIIYEEKLIKQGEKVVVAVSGGPDSVALLYALHQLRQHGLLHYQLVTAHVNHQFRGEESDREEQFVIDFSNQLNIPVKTIQINVPKYMDESGMGAQEAARLKRYEFLKNVAVQVGAGKIALAHHADDQAETVIHRFIRGTSLSGLAGMQMRRTEGQMEIIRPFLQLYKQQIVDFCTQERLNYCLDSSNEQRKYVRNQIRLDLIPMMEQINPNVKASVNRLSDMIQMEDDLLHKMSVESYQRFVEQREAECIFSVTDFIKLHVALQRRLIKLILNYLFEPLTVDYNKVEIIRTALNSSKSSFTLDIGGHILFQKEYDKAKMSFQSGSSLVTPQAGYSYIYTEPQGTLLVPEAAGIFSFMLESVSLTKPMEQQSYLHNERASHAFFDTDQLKWPLQIRNRRDGDRIETLGLGGTKKVKKLFIDEKLAPSQRNQQPILVDGEDRILWIPGLRRSKHALIREQTTRMLHVKWETLTK